MTQPLAFFMREVGEAVAHLNTAVVGLDAVENNYEKPEKLNISWNPKDRKSAARKARRFILESTLIRITEAIDQYIEAISELPQIKKFKKECPQNYSKADKLYHISERLIGKQCFLSAGACLLIHWRNRTVHINSSAKLNQQQKKILIESRRKIQDNFSNLSVDRLLENFRNQTPTLKDISSLISMTIQLIRKLDSRLGDLSRENLDALLQHFNLQHQIDKIKLETKPEKRNESIIRLLKTKAPRLESAYIKFFVD